MKSIDAGMQTMLNAAGGARMTLATLMQITRVDGQVFRFCSHNTNLTFGGNVYRSALGYTRADIQNADTLEVGNTNVKGALNDDSITEDDLHAGKWDNFAFRIFMVDYENLTRPAIKMRKGWGGEVSTGRNSFEAELRGMMQAYSQVIGRIYSADCDAVFGDTRCGFDKSSVTVSGVLSGVSSDGTTLFDVGRREPGPAGGVAITNVSNSNPAVVTFSGDLTLTEGEGVVLSGIIGPASLNTVTVAHNPTSTTFELSVDTTDTGAYPPYVSGGVVIPGGATSGYFDFGVITFLSGLNAGLSMEVKSYVPGQMTLQLPMEHQSAAGDIYTMGAGCDKTVRTCISKFNNVDNHRGFPYLPGIDKIVQVGRHGDGSTSSGGSSGGSAGGTSGSGSGGGGSVGGSGSTGGTNGGGTVDPGGGGTVAPGDTLQNVDARFLNLPQVGPHGYPSAFYVSAAGATDSLLSGFAIYKSFDGTTFNNYVTFGPAQVNAMGVTSSALDDGVVGDALDTTSTVTVVIGAGGGTLTSDATAQSYANYKNLILIGSELIQFRTATPTGPNTYQLSNLYRGCYGTEYAITGHASVEPAVFVNAYNDGYTQQPDGIVYNGIVEVWDPLSPIGTPNYDDIGNPYTYKVVGAGKHLADASPIAFTNTGESMRPICPYSIAGARNGGGDLAITWQQRFWLNGGWVTSLAGTIPPGWNTNFATTHDVKIYSDGTYTTLLRTLSVSGNTNTVTYTAAQQTGDFGSAQSSVHVKITENWTYQPAGGPLTFASHPATRVL